MCSREEGKHAGRTGERKRRDITQGKGGGGRRQAERERNRKMKWTQKNLQNVFNVGLLWKHDAWVSIGLMLLQFKD